MLDEAKVAQRIAELEAEHKAYLQMAEEMVEKANARMSEYRGAINELKRLLVTSHDEDTESSETTTEAPMA